jgi:PHP family Zn ribbon phosphoesterase
MKSSAILSEDTLFADLHIHSCFSIATSRDMLPRNILEGCRRKGIRVVGSGDAFCARWREMWEAEDGQDVLVVPTAEVETVTGSIT